MGLGLGVKLSKEPRTGSSLWVSRRYHGLWGPRDPGHFCLRGGKIHIFDENEEWHPRGLGGADGVVGLATKSRVSH